MSDDFSLVSAGRALDGAISRFVHGLVTPSPPRADEWSAALAQYRAARDKTIDIIRDLTQVQSDFSSGQGVWSIGQNVEHLLLTEDLYRTQIQNLIDLARKGGKTNIDLTFQQINTSIAFIPREVMPMFSVPLNVFNLFVPRVIRETMFRVPLIPAVSPSVSEPARNKPIAELRSRLVTSLAATEEVFRAELPPNLGSMTLSHPILGTNNIVQIFGIISAHEERHHGQMRGVLRNPRYPK
jgi:hypothetical protein